MEVLQFIGLHGHMVHFRSTAVEAPSYIRLFALARGGMGSVDLGLRSEGAFSRLVAIKRPRASDDEGDAALRMFLDEAAITGLIRHPNVVSTYDFGHDPQGPFLVMEYVEGNSLRHLLEKLRADDQRLPIQHALKILIDAARGLHAAHELKTVSGEPLQVIHRDVSPGNIMLGVDGQCKVADFGIAKIWGRGTKTETGILKGKIGYLSPEQLRFQVPDHRADLYSLGVVLYEMVAGKRLHDSTDFREVAWSTLEGDIADLGEARLDCPPELVQLCAQMLAKEPSQRPSSAKEVAERADLIHSGLVDREGGDAFGEYLYAFFGDELEALQDRVRNALAETQTHALIESAAVPVAAPREATHSAIVELEAFVHERNRKRRRTVMIAVGLLVAIAGWATWQSLPVRHPRDIESRAAVERTTPTEPSNTEPVQTITEPVQTSTEQAQTSTEPAQNDTEQAQTITESARPASEPGTTNKSKRRARTKARTRVRPASQRGSDSELMEW